LEFAASLGAITYLLLAAGRLDAQDLRTAVQAALNTNPEILQAAHNKEAIEEERRQAQGLYGPRATVEASGGVRWLKNDTRRALNIADDTLYPVEGDLTVEQRLIDFGRARSELSRQASRTDAAANRVAERSEYIALNVSRHYIDYILQQRLLAAAQDNVSFHERLVTSLREGVSSGSISIADQQQAEERLQAALAKVVEAREELANASIEFEQLTGLPIGNPTPPPEFRGQLPANIDLAVDRAVAENPMVKEAMADIDTARFETSAAKADQYPQVSLEGRVRAGNDIDGFDGATRDYMGRVVLRWTVFDSGITRAKVREMSSREREKQARLDEVSRQAVADVRAAWARLENQHQLVAELERQGQINDNLIVSYREQFNIGRRSLLDLLDAQNTRFNTVALTETARLAELYAQYRVLAACNQLTEVLGVTSLPAANAGARQRYGVRSVTRAEVSPPPSGTPSPQ